ncbi:unnamed protein product [Cyprideis torosa]|uniref:Uncharacterized protein n=1 Tax=Cyprideis torosa TaxID=163714 RepID=A0A7R8ZPY4_9CRUS|nr:unnamed protein product [Cyprideis torosa]CAG0900046.1 unnamed protein product [Cyprideis torosa]
MNAFSFHRNPPSSAVGVNDPMELNDVSANRRPRSAALQRVEVAAERDLKLADIGLWANESLDWDGKIAMLRRMGAVPHSSMVIFSSCNQTIGSPDVGAPRGVSYLSPTSDGHPPDLPDYNCVCFSSSVTGLDHSVKFKHRSRVILHRMFTVMPLFFHVMTGTPFSPLLDLPLVDDWGIL